MQSRFQGLLRLAIARLARRRTIPRAWLVAVGWPSAGRRAPLPKPLPNLPFQLRSPAIHSELPKTRTVRFGSRSNSPTRSGGSTREAISRNVPFRPSTAVPGVSRWGQTTRCGSRRTEAPKLGGSTPRATSRNSPFLSATFPLTSSVFSKTSIDGRVGLWRSCRGWGRSQPNSVVVAHTPFVACAGNRCGCRARRNRRRRWPSHHP